MAGFAKSPLSLVLVQEPPTLGADVGEVVVLTGVLPLLSLGVVVVTGVMSTS